MPSTTSFTVTERAFLMAFTPERGTEQKENPRRGVMLRLSDVRGAWKGNVTAGHSGETRTPSTPPADRTRWSDVRAARNGVAAKRGIARRAISHPDGIRSRWSTGVPGR